MIQKLLAFFMCVFAFGHFRCKSRVSPLSFHLLVVTSSKILDVPTFTLAEIELEIGIPGIKLCRHFFLRVRVGNDIITIVGCVCLTFKSFKLHTFMLLSFFVRFKLSAFLITVALNEKRSHTPSDLQMFLFGVLGCL